MYRRHTIEKRLDVGWCSASIARMSETRICESCGREYQRKCGVSAAQWKRSRVCSHGCATVLGQKNRKWPSAEERFWKKVDKSAGHGPGGDCWLWTGSRYSTGYGAFRYEGKIHKAHRISFLFANGMLPDGHGVRHGCDNLSCVNPDHLRIAGCIDNMGATGRPEGTRTPHRSRHYGAKLTEAQVRAIRHDKRSYAVIAKEYGVTKSAIQHVKSGLSWRHIF